MDFSPQFGNSQQRKQSRRTRSELPSMEPSMFFDPSKLKSSEVVTEQNEESSYPQRSSFENRAENMRKRESRRTKSELPAIETLLLNAYSNEAEDKVVSIVEDQRQESNAGEWTASVQGEQPPLDRFPLGENVFSSDHPEGVASFQSLARRVMMNSKTEQMTAMGNLFIATDKEDTEDIFAQDTHDAPHQTAHTDAFISGAEKVNELFKEEDSISPSMTSSMATDAEGEPLLPTTNVPPSTYGSSLRRKRKVRKRGKVSQFWCLPRNQYSLAEIVNPEECRKSLRRLLLDSGITYIVLPCMIVSFVLFYWVSNIALDFMPGTAPLSWWLLFVARQVVTMELAMVLQHLVVEGLALRTKWLVLAFGPLITLGVIQAKGWPLVAIFWSITDLCLLHGPHPFQQNWLYFLNVGLFSQKGAFLESEFYLGLLLSMLLAGTCHAVKRTTVALSFGKQTLVQYKARMEKILTDIVLITEVAQLAKELLNLEMAQQQRRVNPVIKKDNKWRSTMDVTFSGARRRYYKKATNQSLEIGNSMDSLHADNNNDEDDDDDDHSSSSSSGLNEDSDGMTRMILLTTTIAKEVAGRPVETR